MDTFYYERRILLEFLRWLDYQTDAFDPVMIELARANGKRHMPDRQMNDLVATFLAVEWKDKRGTPART